MSGEVTVVVFGLSFAGCVISAIALHDVVAAVGWAVATAWALAASRAR